MDHSRQDVWINVLNQRKASKSRRRYLFVKRFMDVALVLLSSPFWIPVFGIIGLLIRITSPGAPVLFNQLRTGKGGKRFQMFKFRTMVPNAEALKVKYANLNELKWPDFKITHDPRVTSLGRILRKTSLDEFPQLLNVLRGEMSLVGPRPTSFGPETYELWHTQRLDVMPGITGLWQIEGRAQLEFDDRLRLDIAYIAQANILFDINILIRTASAVFHQRGAH